MPTIKKIYLLKDLSRATGHSTYTLKYYLQLGLFKEIGRSPETNFRYFDDSSIQKLKEIRGMKTQGFSLKKINERIHESL
ncbi:MAG: MerR family transcriptional regulator [Candidatus Omnitrophota bacterium]